MAFNHTVDSKLRVAFCQRLINVLQTIVANFLFLIADVPRSVYVKGIDTVKTDLG